MPLVANSGLITTAFVGSLPVSAIMNDGRNLLGWEGFVPGVPLSTVYAPLINSLILTRGTGDPTFSRSTAAWRFNELGLLQRLGGNLACFEGARLVRNTVRVKSEDLSTADWTKVGVTVSGTNIIVSSAATTQQSFNQPGAGGLDVNEGESFRYSARVKRIAGGVDFIQIAGGSGPFGSLAFCNFSLIDGTFNAQTGVVASSTLVATDTYDFSIVVTATASGTANDVFVIALVNSLTATRVQAFVGDGVKSVQVLRTMSINVTGYASTYVPEYVSLGVVASPFFGAGIDGTRYFTTDQYGAPLSYSSLLGFRSENAATNNVLWNRDLSNAAWTKTNVTAAKTATGLDWIANTASTVTFDVANGTVLQAITLANAARCASAYVRRKTGTGTISFTQNGGSDWTDITSQLNTSTFTKVQITATLPNPSIGFRGATAGDVIEVDGVMNTAGTVDTSLILTTTAAVTRNAESLTYQTASNWSDTAGTAYIEVQPLAWSGGAIGDATNGMLLSATDSGATVSDGTNTANGPTGTPGTKEKLAFRWNGSEMDVASSGAIGTVGVYDGGMGLSSIGVGVGASGYFRNLTIYDTKLADDRYKEIVT